MGFKAEQFVKSVDENLFCSICHEVFEDPVSCKDGHTFCKDCIHEWLKTNRKCPFDNVFLAKKHLVHLLTVKGIIANLEVYCHRCTQDKPSEVKDFVRCDWIGKLQNLTQHRKTCPFQEVWCSQCNLKLQRRKVEQHEKICDFRKVECEKCGMVLLQHEKEKHIKDDCLQALVVCPNRCRNKQQLIVINKRIDLADHLSKVCPKALVNCPYKEQGCVVKVERQDVEKHVQENMAAHMMLLAKECSILSLRCSTLEQTNSELKDELQQIKDNFEDTLSNVNTYTWTIHDYPSLSNKYPNGSWLRSPTFWLSGYGWFLKLYPNGDANANESMSLYLSLSNEHDQLEAGPVVPCSEVLLVFRLKLVSKELGTNDHSMESTNDFSNTKSTTWGWNEFKKASDVLSAAYCNSTNGSVTIQCIIQPDKPQ